MERILFSPIGSTDPISGQHDGALLHIIREYKPCEVYLYMSKEICEYEDKDHRYTYCLKKLEEKLGITLKINIIRREELVDVHIFDTFLIEFKKMLSELCKVHPDDEILLNVSSGTPAMKSALQLLSTTSEKALIPIQVSTPAKRINEREDLKGDYAVELQWELNLDNEEDYENRCKISSVMNMSLEIKRSLIKQQIAAYDYVAALRIAEPIELFLDQQAMNLLRAAAARLKLDKANCSKYCKLAGYDMYPVKDSDKWGIFEYLLLIDIKRKKEEYADFLRAITPLFTVIMERIIRNSGEIDLDRYILREQIKTGTGPKNTILRWDNLEVQTNPLLQDIRTTNIGKGPVVKTEDYYNLILQLNIDMRTKQLVQEIREMERSIRNPAAHAIIYVTEDVIKQYTGFSSKQIFQKLQELCIKAGITIREQEMHTYETLNQEICQRIDILV